MTIRVVNVLFIFLIGIILLLWQNNEKAFLLFALSPLTWYISIQTTPIIPASLCFLLCFLFFRSKIPFNRLYSGIFLGLSIALYTPMLLIAAFFILVYFWNSRLSYLILYLITIFIGTLPRLIQDYLLFNNPLYTFIRYAGNNSIVAIGRNTQTSMLHIFSNLGLLILILISITPLLFMIYKIKFKENKKIMIFLILSFLLLLIRAAGLKYFLIISPIILLLLSNVLTKKQVIISIIISLLIIPFLTFSYFNPIDEKHIQEDLAVIINESNPEYIISSPFKANKFAAFLWSNESYFIWGNNFKTEQESKESIRGYTFELGSNIPNREKLSFSASFDLFKKREYEDYIVISQEEDKQSMELDYILLNCYKELCTYES